MAGLWIRVELDRIRPSVKRNRHTTLKKKIRLWHWSSFPLSQIYKLLKCIIYILYIYYSVITWPQPSKNPNSDPQAWFKHKFVIKQTTREFTGLQYLFIISFSSKLRFSEFFIFFYNFKEFWFPNIYKYIYIVQL